MDNALFTYDASSTQFKALSGNEIFWESKDATLSVFAYYPYAPEVTSVSAMPISVKENQSSASDFYSSDFLTAQVKGRSQNAPNVNLIFKHSLSRINVAIKRGQGFSDSEWGQLKTLTLEKAAIGGTVNIEDGVVSSSSANGNILFLATETGSNEPSKFSAIVFPKGNQSGVTFRFKLGEDTYSYTPSTFSAVSGKQYNYSFVIDAASDSNKMTLVGAEIAGWGDAVEMSEQTMDKD